MTMTPQFPMPPLPRVSWAESTRDRALAEAPRVPWDVFLRRYFKWNQGEHVSLIGPTGQGKTTLLTNLMPLRQFVVVFATKPKDPTMNRLIHSGYTKISSWQNKRSALDTPRRVLWPNARRLGSISVQREAFKDAFEKIYVEGGWTVVIDELWYIDNVLGLEHEVKMFLLQGRSLGLSLVSGTQRPAFVPLEVYDQSTHLFFWRDNDETNLKRLSSINARSSALVKTLVQNLEQYQVLYINTRTGDMVRTRVPFPRKGN